MTVSSVNVIGSDVQFQGGIQSWISETVLSEQADAIIKAMKDDALNIRHFQGQKVGAFWHGDTVKTVVTALSRFKLKDSWGDLKVRFVYTESNPSEALTKLAERAFYWTRYYQNKEVTLYATRFIEEEVYIALSRDNEVVIGKTAQAVAAYVQGDSVSTLELKWPVLKKL